jgi:hypothetical protein
MELEERFDRLWHWLLGTPPLWAVRDLGTFLHWIVPVLIVLSAALALINHRQQETPAQASLTRFLWAKAAFWGVVEISFHARASRLFVLLDWAVVTVIAVTSLDLLARLIRRYVLVPE